MHSQKTQKSLVSKTMKLQLFPETSYRLSLFPIIGGESNVIIDNEGFGTDTLEVIEEKYIEQTERSYDIIFDFYASDDGMYYSIEDGNQEELNDNALDINRSKYDLEEWEEEPDEDFMLIEDLQMADNCDRSDRSDSIEVFKDIQIRHNETTDDHLDIIVDAIRRRMTQVTKQLVAEGLAENEESVRFALQYGQVSGCQYSFDIDAEEFDPDVLRVIDCTDWNDCRISETLQEFWPDRLVGNVVYDGKFYTGECEQVDSFDYHVDLVDCNLKSVR